MSRGSSWNTNAIYTPTPEPVSNMIQYRRKSYEPWRIVNLWKKGKDGGRRLWRKTHYHGKELVQKIERWRHR